MMRVLSLWSAQAHRELVQALLKLWTHRFRALVRGAAEAHGDGGADLAAALGRLDEQIELAVQMVGAVLLVAPCYPVPVGGYRGVIGCMQCCMDGAPQTPGLAGRCRDG